MCGRNPWMENLKICSEDEMENEMKYIKSNLKMNRFPKKTVEKQIS